MRLLAVLTASLLLTALAVPSALAAPPTLPTLNPPPPDFLTCMATGGGAICSGTTVDSFDVAPSGFLCGATADPIELLFLDSRTNISVIRYYNKDGNLTRRLRREHTLATVLNPVTGLTILTTQIAEFTFILATPGDFDTATETQRGVVKFYLPGAGVLFIDVGRAVLPPDPSLGSDTGQHPFDQYFNGDTSVFEAVCAALGSPGTPPLG